MKQVFSAIISLAPSLVAVAMLAPSCGSSQDKSGAVPTAASLLPSATSSAAATATATSAVRSASVTPATPAVPQTFAFTAKYTERPVDVVIIRDPATRVEPLNTQINSAALMLAARLWNLPNVHVGVFDTWFPAPAIPAKHAATATPTPTPVPQPTSATPIVDATAATATGSGTATSTLVQTGPILDATALSANEFGTALEGRVAKAGTRGGVYEPAATLLDIMAESKKPSGGLIAGLLRPEAYWSVIYLSAALNPDDPYDAGDVMTAFTPQAGNFMISTLAIDEGGCVVVGTNPPMLFNKNKSPMRNLETKLAQATQGVVASICTNTTYAIFADDVVNGATGTGFFTVTLPGAIDPKTIKIAANGVLIPDFRYTEGSTSLEVSTLVPNGEAFTVTATLLVPVAVAGGAAAGTAAASAESAFLAGVQPSLVKICAPCHSGNTPQTFNTDQGFAAAGVAKRDMANRINSTVAGTQMPPGVDLKTADPAAYNAINAWAAGP